MSGGGWLVARITGMRGDLRPVRPPKASGGKPAAEQAGAPLAEAGQTEAVHQSVTIIEAAQQAADACVAEARAMAAEIVHQAHLEERRLTDEAKAKAAGVESSARARAEAEIAAAGRQVRELKQEAERQAAETRAQAAAELEQARAEAERIRGEADSVRVAAVREAGQLAAQAGAESAAAVRGELESLRAQLAALRSVARGFGEQLLTSVAALEAADSERQRKPAVPGELVAGE